MVSCSTQTLDLCRPVYGHLDVYVEPASRGPQAARSLGSALTGNTQAPRTAPARRRDLAAGASGRAGGRSAPRKIAPTRVQSVAHDAKFAAASATAGAIVAALPAPALPGKPRAASSALTFPGSAARLVTAASPDAGPGGTQGLQQGSGSETPAPRMACSAPAVTSKAGAAPACAALGSEAAELGSSGPAQARKGALPAAETPSGVLVTPVRPEASTPGSCGSAAGSSAWPWQAPAQDLALDAGHVEAGTAAAAAAADASAWRTPTSGVTHAPRRGPVDRPLPGMGAWERRLSGQSAAARGSTTSPSQGHSPPGNSPAWPALDTSVTGRREVSDSCGRGQAARSAGRGSAQPTGISSCSTASTARTAREQAWPESVRDGAEPSALCSHDSQGRATLHGSPPASVASARTAQQQSAAGGSPGARPACADAHAQGILDHVSMRQPAGPPSTPPRVPALTQTLAQAPAKPQAPGSSLPAAGRRAAELHGALLAGAPGLALAPELDLLLHLLAAACAPTSPSPRPAPGPGIVAPGPGASCATAASTAPSASAAADSLAVATEQRLFPDAAAAGAYAALALQAAGKPCSPARRLLQPWRHAAVHLTCPPACSWLQTSQCVL